MPWWVAIVGLSAGIVFIGLAPRHRLVRDGPVVRFPAPEVLRICWADRLAGVVALFLCVGLALMWAPNAAPPTAAGGLLLYAALPAWIIFRLLDLIMGGPRFRQAARVKREDRSQPCSITQLIEVLPPERPSARSRMG